MSLNHNKVNSQALILAEDEEIIKSSDVYSYVYSIVQSFVNKYNLLKRKSGSRLSYWLNIDCGEHSNGYYFETSIKENMVEYMTKNILYRFESLIEELVKNKCSIEIDKGL